MAPKRATRLLAVVAVGSLILAGCSMVTGTPDNNESSDGGDSDEYTVSGSITTDDSSETNQSFTLSLNSGTETVTKAVTDSNYEFSTEISGQYTITVSSQPQKQYCTVGNASGTADSDVTADVSCTTTPQLTSSTPADGAENVSTVSSQIEFVFNEPLDTGVTPALNMYVSSIDSDGDPLIDTSGSVLSMDVLAVGTNVSFSSTHASNDTVTITLSWVRFPENAPLTYELSLVQDAAGNAMTTATGAFLTGQESYSGSNGNFVRNPVTSSIVTNDAYSSDPDTGARWLSCPLEEATACDSTIPAENFKPWHELINYCAQLNESGGFGGRTNWRLATISELESLHDPNGTACGGDPYVYSGLSGCNASYVYASSTWDAGSSGPYRLDIGAGSNPVDTYSPGSLALAMCIAN